MTSKSLFASALAASFCSVSAIVSGAHAAPPQSCIFEQYAPSVVTPYVADTFMDYGSYSYLGGAQLFVPAREGLTSEWLTSSVQQLLNQSADQRDRNASAACSVPGVKDINVSVVSGGTGFWVRLIGRDYNDSQSLLRWANRAFAKRSSARLSSR